MLQIFCILPLSYIGNALVLRPYEWGFGIKVIQQMQDWADIIPSHTQFWTTVINNTLYKKSSHVVFILHTTVICVSKKQKEDESFDAKFIVHLALGQFF